MIRHFLSDLDVSSHEQTLVLRTAKAMKHNPQDYRTVLSGHILGMVFKKNSTRTRASFEAGMIQLGGQAIFLSAKEVQIGRGEPISDTGRVLSSYVDMIMIRTYAHEEVQELSRASKVPVINGLDDLLHPCQALADLMTVDEERGGVKGQQMVFVGDGNNVAHSLMYAGALAGMHVRVVCPEGYAPAPEIVGRAQKVGEASGARIEVTHDLGGVDGADVVYTDVWASMGQEAESQRRAVTFAGFQVDASLMRRARKDAIFMHCLPAHRGEEVATAVLEGPASRVFQQAENRLHAQKALMAFLAGRLT
jgi:ornithine carbamoyltransferase